MRESASSTLGKTLDPLACRSALARRARNAVVGCVLILTVSTGLVASVDAQVFRWVDKNGKVHYGDIPDDLNSAESVRNRASNTDMSGMREQGERLRERQASSRQATASVTSVEPERQGRGAAAPTQAQLERHAAQMKRYEECMVRTQRALASNNPAAGTMVDLCAAMLPRPIAQQRNGPGPPTSSPDATLTQLERYNGCVRDADRLQSRNPAGAALQLKVCASLMPTTESRGSTTPCYSDVACPSGQKCVRTTDMSSGVCRRVVNSYGVADHTTRAGGTVVGRCTSDFDCGVGGSCRSLDGNPANKACVRR